MARVHSGDGFTLTLPVHVLLASSKLVRMVFVPGVDEQDFLLPSVRGTTLLLLVELLRCGKSKNTGSIGYRDMASLDEIQQVMEVLQIEGCVGIMRVGNNVMKDCEKDMSESQSLEEEWPSSPSEPLEPISNLEIIIPRHQYYASNGDSDMADLSDIKPDIVDMGDLSDIKPDNVEKVAEKKNFQLACHVCGKDFTKKSTWIAHIRHNHSDALFPCTDCSKKFILKNSLELHVQAIHKGNASCNYCPNSYKNAKALKYHIRNCHRDKMSPCTECNKSFILPDSLKYHMETFHSRVTEKKNFQRACHVCGKNFTKKGTWIAHIRHNHSDALIPCTDCNKKFILKHTLELHVQAIHKGNASCNYCPNSYKNAKKLKDHIRSCHRDIMSPCTECNKSFILPDSLKYHMETFHSKELFVCEVCHARFDKRKKLEAHVRHVHSGIRHVCQKCKATFSTRESLTRHTRNIHEKTSVVEIIADHEDIHRSDQEETEGNDLDQDSNMNIELPEVHFGNDLM